MTFYGGEEYLQVIKLSYKVMISVIDFYFFLIF